MVRTSLSPLTYALHPLPAIIYHEALVSHVLRFVHDKVGTRLNFERKRRHRFLLRTLCLRSFAKISMY